MSDLRTAALRALDALEHAGQTGDWILAGPAITALKGALAEPVQPVQHEYEVTANDDGTFSFALPDGEELRIIPPQRPAAPIIQPEIKDDKPFGYFRAEPFGWTDCAPTDEGAIPLYDKPQGKLLPWKGLTEEEHTYYKGCGFVGVKAVEEKLRARNSTLACIPAVPPVSDVEQ